MNLDNLILALKTDEGFKPVVYDDSTGFSVAAGDTIVGSPTIGYGWNCAANPMTEAQASDRLRYDAIRATQAASALIPSWLSIDDVRQNVLSNMCFNMGPAGLAKFRRMLSAIDSKDWTAAAAEGRGSAWFRQVGKRAQRLMDELETGKIA